MKQKAISKVILEYSKWVVQNLFEKVHEWYEYWRVCPPFRLFTKLTYTLNLFPLLVEPLPVKLLPFLRIGKVYIYFKKITNLVDNVVNELLVIMPSWWWWSMNDLGKMRYGLNWLHFAAVPMIMVASNLKCTYSLGTPPRQSSLNRIFTIFWLHVYSFETPSSLDGWNYFICRVMKTLHHSAHLRRFPEIASPCLILQPVHLRIGTWMHLHRLHPLAAGRLRYQFHNSAANYFCMPRFLPC